MESFSKVNKDFLIRWNFYGEKKTFLIGAGQYHKIVGRATAERHFQRVLNSTEGKVVFKERERLEAVFVAR